MDLFRRLFFAAVLAGTVAGFVNAGLQQWRLVPLILHAETYEEAASPEDPGVSAPESQTHADVSATAAWAPGAGFERTFYSILAAFLAGIGFAALLNGISVVVALPLTATNGFLWGLGGFAAFSLAPALGLAPELPGMAAAELGARQTWWWFTALATAAAFLGMAKAPRKSVYILGAVLIALPHVVGAPEPISAGSAVPPHLASAFAANALGIALIFWVTTGALLGWLNTRFAGKNRMPHRNA
jgi:cobalt transporter subunit CbtA